MRGLLYYQIDFAKYIHILLSARKIIYILLSICP
jgi:hypothetical protein